MGHASLRSAIFFGLVCAWLFMGTSLSVQETKADEQTTGSGGHLLRYSSKQVTVDLMPREQAAFEQARDRCYPAAKLHHVLDATAAVLKQQGYTAISIDREFGSVEARHDELLVSKTHEVLRGVLKSRMGFLPGRPDHQSTEALVMLMPQQDGHGVMVRARFRTTVWDSNGDSRTTIVSDAAVYRDFYAAVGAYLQR